MEACTVNPVVACAPIRASGYNPGQNPGHSIEKIRPEGVHDFPVQIEVARLLDDSRSALEVDLNDATALAKCLACLLDKSKSLSVRANPRHRFTGWQRRKVESFIDE